MRVAGIYNTDRFLGGGEISFTLTLKCVQSAAWNVLAIVPGPGCLSEHLTQNGIATRVLPQESLRRLIHLRHLISPSAEWLQLMREFQPDVIHCNAVRPALYAQAVGRKLGIPVILHARKEMPDPIDPFLIPRLDGVICISQTVRRRFAPFPRTRFKIVHNAVDLLEFERPANSAPLRRQWTAGGKGPVIGLPGRLSPIKGQLRLIEAAPRILKRLPNSVFVFLGEEDDSYRGFASRLEQAIRSKGLQRHVVFAGHQADMASAYHALDAVVFPTSSEGFGRVVIEAGAARKPLIANDLGVLREILPHPSDDYVVDCDDAELFSDRIIRVLSNAQFALGTAARLYDHVRRSFAPESHRDSILEMYQEVLEDSKR